MRYYKDWGNRKVRAIVVFLVMNLFTCIWNPVTNVLIANEGIRNVVQAIVTKVVTGGVAMVIIFAADNKIFAPSWGGKKRNNAERLSYRF